MTRLPTKVKRDQQVTGNLYFGNPLTDKCEMVRCFAPAPGSVTQLSDQVHNHLRTIGPDQLPEVRLSQMRHQLRLGIAPH